MAEYDTCLSSTEKCRLCGIELPSGTVETMYHYNSHWREPSPEPQNLSQCLYESSDMRLNPISHNPEDIEVSCHFDQNIQYSYSPQTEPSNLCLSEPRCSPLNLTGRQKPKSPVVSPLSSPHPQEVQLSVPNNSHVSSSFHETHPQMTVNPYINVTENFESYNTLNSCSMANHMLSLPFPINDSVNNDCLVESQIDSCQQNRKRRKTDRTDERYLSYRCPNPGRIPDQYFDNSKQQSNLPINDHEFGINDSLNTSNHAYQTPMKPYKCSVCNSEFSLKQELSDHVLIHDAAKPYKCNLCGTGLSHVSALRRHTLAHEGHKPYICDVCNRGFLQKCDLQRHYGIHRKKPSQCNKCNKKYNSDYLLKNHKCKPKEPKPFKCDICGEGCATNVAWSYHMWKHTKNPIFVPCQSANSNKTIVPHETIQ